MGKRGGSDRGIETVVESRVEGVTEESREFKGGGEGFAK